ncbi:hypothetical protein [Vibrio sp. 10N.239.312.D08]|uniref:hypothetical protein n=1 Tax=Vibrio sp. 10N.239.312.D08 TaxID=3229978 RepID=UPI00354DE0F3
MKKRICLVGITAVLMFGCDSSNELDKNIIASIEESSAKESHNAEGMSGSQSEIKEVKAHVIPASDIRAINELYENAKTSPDLLRTALKESSKFESLGADAKRNLRPISLEQLNRSDDGSWTAYFISDQAEYIIPLTEFKGTTINGIKMQVVVDEKGEYFISSIG